MKTNRLNILVCFLILLGCSNVEQGNVTGSPEREAYICFIRFKNDDSIKNYIIAETIDGDTAQMRGTPGVIPELFLGNNPYIAASNEYYVVDWKWGQFLYRPTNVILDIPWTSLSDWNQQWSLDTINTIPKGSISIGSIGRREIDKLLNIDEEEIYNINCGCYYNPNYQFPDLYMQGKSIEDIEEMLGKGLYGGVMDEYYKDIARQDSIQDIYLSRFNLLIDKGIDMSEYTFFK